VIESSSDGNPKSKNIIFYTFVELVKLLKKSIEIILWCFGNLNRAKKIMIFFFSKIISFDKRT
jgi:hypothetical protein